MQFDRSALIEAINQAIKLEVDAKRRVDSENAAMENSWRQEWLSLHTEGWTKATTAIRTKLRKGEPITENDIPRDRTGYGSQKAFYRPKRGTQIVTVTTELVGLRQVLSAIRDDTISSSSLRSLGVGANTLRKVVPLLGAATVRTERTAG